MRKVALKQVRYETSEHEGDSRAGGQEGGKGRGKPLLLGCGRKGERKKGRKKERKKGTFEDLKL